MDNCNKQTGTLHDWHKSLNHIEKERLKTLVNNDLVTLRKIFIPYDVLLGFITHIAVGDWMPFSNNTNSLYSTCQPLCHSLCH